MNWGKLGLALMITASTSACSQGRNWVVLIDTSASMNEQKLIDQVKQSTKKLLLESKPGDRVAVLAFDEGVQALGQKQVQTPSELALFFDRLDQLEAKGKWTNLVTALDASLRTAVDFQKEYPRSQTHIVLYTDGKHDPGPEAKARALASGSPTDFRSLFHAYYKDSKPTADWFIYYVELKQADPQLERFLASTGSGIVLSQEAFDQGLIFGMTRAEFGRKAGIGVGSFLLLLLIFQLFVHPRFRTEALESKRASIVRLGALDRPFLRFHVQAAPHSPTRIGVDWLGRYYVKPVNAGVVLINGKLATEKTYIHPGQRIQLGAQEFEFKKSA